MEIENFSQYQCQMLLDSQKLIQLQDQRFSNEILMTVLSQAESLSRLSHNFPNNEPRKYGYYDLFENGRSLEKQELLKKFLFDLHIFGHSYSSYKEEHNGQYDFPGNLEKNKILEEIKHYWQYADPEIKKYYIDFYNLIKEGKIPDYRKEIKEIKKNLNQDCKFSAYDYGRAGPVTRQALEKMQDDVRKRYENGAFTTNVVIGGEYENNDKAKRIFNSYKNKH